MDRMQIKKRRLGNTDIEISKLGFGAWAMGGLNYGKVDKNESIEAVKAYIDAGGNHIDTARMYGESEEILGKIFKDKAISDQIILASKTYFGEKMDQIPLIERDLETSLKKLNRDYLDIYYLHIPPDDEETMHAALDELQRLKKRGFIRTVGASIKAANVSTHTVDLSRQYIASGKVDVLMLVYSIFRQMNEEIFSESYDAGIGIVARTALESGFLTGKFLPGHRFRENDHRARWGEKRLDRIFTEVNELQKILVEPPYETLGQVALKFAISDPRISSLIVGAVNKDMVYSNINPIWMPPLSHEVLSEIKRFKDKTELYNLGEDE